MILYFPGRAQACARAENGTSLIEVLIASSIAGVGTLAVFTLFLHWYPQLDDLTDRYQTLNQRQLDQPLPYYTRRVELFQCEKDVPDQAGLIIE
ncbi:type IV pilus modification PilV family protein [Aliidiomarina soli]|uniref:Uncharacterized protein n=1 Tax=Aliidiomarina soli TaxID=1928574 RepID=A0A432WCX0_9GAMM|nr:hypothetical protein [Aliidiomarina soli]RUO30249.1 hypothetical protein CWE14_12790 [Aliidiomarina soli]